MAPTIYRSIILATLLLSASFAAAIEISAAADDSANAAQPTPAPTLIFVAELCRHGDRTPLFEFSNDALPGSRWPEGAGQLTAIGQRAHFDLGARLRTKYIDSGFLSDSYKHSEIYVRSSDVDRTHMSAISQLTGLYPPGTASTYDVRIRFGGEPLHENEGALPHLFQPIPIHSEARVTDLMLLPDESCPRLAQINNRRYASNAYKSKVAKEANFLRAAAKIVKSTKETFDLRDIERLYDTWTCFAAHSVPLHDGASPDIVDHARNVSNWLLSFRMAGEETGKLRAGRILGIVFKHMAKNIVAQHIPPDELRKNPPLKFLLLSAHDRNVAAALSALRVFDGANPPYNSTLFWELYKSHDNDFLVKVEYNGTPLKLEGCDSEYCTMTEYFQSTASRTALDEAVLKQECLIGFRRFASYIGSLFYRRPVSDDWLKSIVGSKQRSGGPRALLFITVGLLGLVAAVALIQWLRKPWKHRGYIQPEDDRLPRGSDSDTFSNRRILM